MMTAIGGSDFVSDTVAPPYYASSIILSAPISLQDIHHVIHSPELVSLRSAVDSEIFVDEYDHNSQREASTEM